MNITLCSFSKSNVWCCLPLCPKASRIESTGLPGRIHVSSATANELLAHGKQSWLIEREDPVEAKGKGVLQTFWIDTDKLERSSVSSLSNLDASMSDSTSQNDTVA